MCVERDYQRNNNNNRVGNELYRANTNWVIQVNNKSDIVDSSAINIECLSRTRTHTLVRWSFSYLVIDPGAFLYRKK